MRQDDSRREIYVGATTSVVELDSQMDVPATHLIGAAFHELGLLLTIHDRIPYELAKELVAHFGFVAHRKQL